MIKEKEMFMLAIQNRCYGLSVYYPEDDWKVILFGETLNNLKEQLPKDLFHSQIAISDVEIYKVKILEYKGEFFIRVPQGVYCPEKINETSFLSFVRLKDEWISKSYSLIKEAKNSQEYKKLVAEKKEKEEKIKHLKRIKKLQDKERKEKAEYLRLKQKYDI